MIFNRVWDSRLSQDTFNCPAIKSFVCRYLQISGVSIDPFSRNKTWATYTNDINPNTLSTYHMDAEEFLVKLFTDGIKADLIILDPPYSPRQISEHYKAAGLPVTMKDTQNARLYKRVRDAADRVLSDTGIVLSFGWNSVGMGVQRKFVIEEILLVCHGSAHNDTICMAERRVEK